MRPDGSRQGPAGPRRRFLPIAAAALGLALVLGGLWQVGWAGWIHAKAALAQVLLERAWERTLAGERGVRPWPWADTYPVARLEVPALGRRQIVLAGASGRTLAFGPAHLDGTAPPAGRGHTVLSGHRDTHFSFLRDLQPGMVLNIQNSANGWQGYEVTGTGVIDARRARLAADSGRPALTLVTCYPFDTLVPGGPLRFLVHARGLDGPGPQGADVVLID